MNRKNEESASEDVIVLRGRKYPVTIRYVNQSELRFYLENPRLYSLVRSEGKEPTEEEILGKLLSMEHVKRLTQSIKDNGGLIDPVIVDGESKVVLEGNSRLAAYRRLAEIDPVKWGRIRAKILPADIDEKDVFALLGEYHIHGKKDWAPFEQAGYLYRRQTKHNIDSAALAQEIGLPKNQVIHLVSVYLFMLEHKETDPGRWSYYDEYLRGRKVTNLRKDYSDLDKLIVKKIRSGEIPSAMQLRDGLKAICNAGGKTMHRFAENKIAFDDAWQVAKDRGASDTCLLRIKRFRNWLAEPQTEDDLIELGVGSQNVARYELKQISKRSNGLIKKLSATK